MGFNLEDLVYASHLFRGINDALDNEVNEERHIEKVIFENGYTIILDSEGNRYMSRPEKGEKFDEEKGLLVALAKYDGHTTTEIQELLKGAIRKNAGKKKKSSGKKN